MENPIAKKEAGKILKGISTKEVGQIVRKILDSDSVQVVHEMSMLVYNHCEKIREKNFQVYNNTVKPLLIKCEHIENKLRDNENLTVESEEKLITELVLTYKDISTEAKNYRDSNTDKILLFIGGVAIGSIARDVIKKIFHQ